MALKDKYPFINQLHYNDILSDLVSNVDELTNNVEILKEKHLYQHVVGFAVQHTASDESENSYQCMIVFNFITDNSTPFTRETFIEHLNNICGNHSRHFMGQGFILYTSGTLAGKYGFAIQLAYNYDTSVQGSHLLMVRFLTSEPNLRQIAYDAVNFVSSSQIGNFYDDVTIVA